jgi:hypothetical protein
MQTMRPRRNPAATYFALPPDQRVDFLKQQIADQEKRREAWEAALAQSGSGNQSGQGGGGGGRNRAGRDANGVAGQGRLNGMKRMLDMTTPAERVQQHIYVGALNNQRAQQGLPPVPGGGFF